MYNLLIRTFVCLVLELCNHWMTNWQTFGAYACLKEVHLKLLLCPLLHKPLAEAPISFFIFEDSRIRQRFYLIFMSNF